MSLDYNRLVVLYGRGAWHLNPSVDLDPGMEIGEFANGETRVQLNRSVRAQDVVYIQSFGRLIQDRKVTINDLLVESILTCDAIQRAGAKSLTVILPLMPYTRQDRKHRAGVPISAKVICDMLGGANVDRLITFDLHADQIQGFMDRGVFDHLSLLPFLCHNIQPHLNEYAGPDKPNDVMCMCATDAGAVYRTRMTGELLSIFQLSIISKLRDKYNSVAEGQLVGNVAGKVCILVDDMIDTGGSLVKASSLLRDNGAKGIIVVATHGILSNNALDKLSLMDHVFLSDTVPHCTSDDMQHMPNITVVGLASFLHDYLLPRIAYKLPIRDLLSASTFTHKDMHGVDKVQGYHR